VTTGMSALVLEGVQNMVICRTRTWLQEIRGDIAGVSDNCHDVVIGQRARGGCLVMVWLVQERPPGAIVRAWCPKRSEEDVLWVSVAAGTG
jgi:hypothetical protein